jgi:hypothetical protein
MPEGKEKIVPGRNNAHQQDNAVLLDSVVKHLERIDTILDRQNDLNQKLSNEQVATKTRLDDALKILTWLAGVVAGLLVAILAGLIVYWLTHPQ